MKTPATIRLHSTQKNQPTRLKMTAYLDCQKVAARSKPGVAVRRMTASTVTGQPLFNTTWRRDTGPKKIRAKATKTPAPGSTFPWVVTKIVNIIAATVIVATLRSEIGVLK